MSISQALLPEFDQEMASTRKLLERVPDGVAKSIGTEDRIIDPDKHCRMSEEGRF